MKQENPTFELEELEIVYQDEYLVALNKPSGLLVHRSWIAAHETQFAMQMVRDLTGKYVYPVHRLDRPTSGVLLFTFSSELAAQLSLMFQEKQVKKCYHAIVRGWLKEEGVLDYPLKEELDKIADKRADQDKEAQDAITAYWPLAQVELPFAVSKKHATSRYGLVRLEPHTGRKHQLRRHMAHLRQPIVGDTTHGDGRHNKFFREHFGFQQLALHASSLQLPHPISGETLIIRANFPSAWQTLFEQLGWSQQAPAAN